MTTEQRIAQEREERLKESADRQIRRSVENGSRPTNAARREETQKRFTELRSPSVPAARPSSAPPAVSGKPVEFYAWKDGAVGKIKILTEGEFTAI